MLVDDIIINSLVYDENYMRKTIPFLKEEYFHDLNKKIIFKTINSYIDRYNAPPSKEAITVDIGNRTDISEDTHKACIEYINNLSKDDCTTLEYKIDQTEKFCQDKAIYNAIMDSIKILDDKTGASAKGAIPQLLSDALAVSFDSSIGHDFLDDTDSRFEFYHRKEERLPFDIDFLNKITRGGLPNKTLNIILAGTGVGKSLAMCHMAAANLVNGKNVLYITMEMAEEKIAERIDANLLNTPLDELYQLPKDTYEKRMARLKEKTVGKLIIKEYPTACAGSANFRHLLNELKIKKNFVADIIYIDYLNICNSSRLKQGSNINSYTYIKAIAEELRGLAVEFNVPIVSATQTTRGGYDNSDVGLTDTSESFGLPATADLMIALISTDELKALNQIMVKQLKNRYADPEMYKRFVIGVDKSRMKLYDVEEGAQDDIVDDSPVYDKTPAGKFDKDKFSGFK